MIKSLFTFLIKAAPRFVGEMMKNPKNVTKLFKKAGEKMAKSKLYAKAEDFLGQKPGAWAKECARDAVKQSATSLMMSAVTGGVSKLFSGGGGKQYSFPNKTSGTTLGGVKAPGVQTTNVAQYSNVKAFNQSSRALGQEANRQLKIRKKQKNIIDRYRRDISRKNFSVAELSALSYRLEKDLQRQKTSLLTGLKSGKHTAEGLRSVQPAKKIKQPTKIPQEQQQLASYTKEALEDMNNQMQENIKAVNENISKSIAAMNKKEEEIAQKMMSNLGNYNTVTYKKLADTVTKTEEVSFKKQQESAYYQTDMLAGKLDADHDYNSKQLDVLRGEVLGNTQTMYELDKQNRMIDENYRALEERKNHGFTIGTLGALLTQTYQMVQSSLKTPDVINENVKHAMNSVAFTAGEEVGKLIQMLKELLQGIRVALVKIWEPVRTVPVVGDILGGLINGIDWVNDRVFRGMLGADDSVVEDMFGRPGNLAEMADQINREKYGDTIGDNSAHGGMVTTTGYAGSLLSSRGIRDVGLAAANMNDLFETNWSIDEKKKTVNVMTNSGYSVTLKHDQQEGESVEDYKKRKLLEAVDKETVENFYYTGDNIASRDNEQEARIRYNDTVRLIEASMIKRSGQRGPAYSLDYTYDVINNSSKKISINYPHSEPPAEHKRSNNKLKNCIEILNDSHFDSAWGGAMSPKDSLTLKGGLKWRLLKAFKQASEKGIKYDVTSIFRAPAVGYGDPSPHHCGIAVDVAIEGIASIIPRCWTKSKGYDPYEHKTYWSVILTSEDLDAIINRSQFQGTESEYDLFVQWGEWQKICKENELSVGVFSYPIASDARGIPDGSKRLDMVHIQVASIAKELTSSQQKDSKTTSKTVSEVSGAAIEKAIKKGQGLEAKLNLDNFEDTFLGNVEGVKQKKNKKVLGIGRDDMDYYYTDESGNIMEEYMTGPMSVKDYVRNDKGSVVKREKNEIEKQIKTDTGMILLDKFKSGQATPEEKEQLKKIVEEYNKLAPEAQKKSGRQNEMHDAQIVVNNYVNNTIVTDNKSELSTGNESNIPQ